MTTRRDREADIWLSDAQLERLARDDEVDQLHAPVPTRMVSNGEHMPIPQTDQQRRVERRIEEPAERGGGILCLGRRRLLATSCGMSAIFLAINKVHGQFFDV